MRGIIRASRSEERSALRLLQQATQPNQDPLLSQKLDYVIRQIHGAKSEKLDPGHLDLFGDFDGTGKPETSDADEAAEALTATAVRLKHFFRYNKIFISKLLVPMNELDPHSSFPVISPLERVHPRGSPIAPLFHR